MFAYSQAFLLQPRLAVSLSSCLVGAFSASTCTLYHFTACFSDADPDKVYMMIVDNLKKGKQVPLCKVDSSMNQCQMVNIFIEGATLHVCTPHQVAIVTISQPEAFKAALFKLCRVAKRQFLLITKLFFCPLLDFESFLVCSCVSSTILHHRWCRHQVHFCEWDRLQV